MISNIVLINAALLLCIRVHTGCAPQWKMNPPAGGCSVPARRRWDIRALPHVPSVAWASPGPPHTRLGSHHYRDSLSGCSTKPSRILASCGRLPICCLGAARWLGADADPGVGAVAAAGVAGVVADADDDPDGLGTTASTAAELSSSVSFIGGSECDGCCCEPPETTCEPHFSI